MVFPWNTRCSQQYVHCLEALSCHSLGFQRHWTSQGSADPPASLCRPLWASLFTQSLEERERQLFGWRSRWCDERREVLPFSFPFFVFLVMLYLHIGPTIRRRCHFCSLTPSLSTSFPKAAVEWKYCGLSNAAGGGSNPGSSIYELSDERWLLGPSSSSSVWTETMSISRGSWGIKGDYIYAPELTRWSINVNSLTPLLMLFSFHSLLCLSF